MMQRYQIVCKLMHKHSEKMQDLIFFKCLAMNFVIFIIFYERMSLHYYIYRKSLLK